MVHDLLVSGSHHDVLADREDPEVRCTSLFEVMDPPDDDRDRRRQAAPVIEYPLGLRIRLREALTR